MVTFLSRSVAAEKDGYPASCERVLALLLIVIKYPFANNGI